MGLEKPGSKGNKIKLFIEVFNTLTSQGMNDVGTKNFIDELLKTSKFTEDEARAYMKKAMQNGQIFERKAGWLSKSL
jgi:replicative DNA helicase Mcm